MMNLWKSGALAITAPKGVCGSVDECSELEEGVAATGHLLVLPHEQSYLN